MLDIFAAPLPNMSGDSGVYHRAAEVGSSDLLSQGALDDVGVVEAFEGPKPQVATSHLRRGS
jgi:hypothetical protein